MAVQRIVFEGARTWTVTGEDYLPAGPVEEFLEHLRAAERSSPNTVRSYATSLDRWWGYLSGAGLAWDEVTLPAFTPYVTSLRTGHPAGVRVLPGASPDRGLAEATVAVRVAAVLSFYRYHADVHQVPVAARLYRLSAGSGRYLPGLAHLRGGRDQLRPAVRLRRGTSRPVPLLTPLQVEAILDGCARWDAAAHRAVDLGNHFVFVNLRRGEWLAPMRPETVYDLVGALKRRLGPKTPPGWTPHWFRHSHASALLLSGAREHVVMRRLGHADVQTTINLYGWVTEDAELRALAGWRSFCGGWREREGTCGE